MNDSFSTMFRSSSADRAPLKVGLLLDSSHLSRATASVIQDLQAADFVRIELLVFNASASTHAAPRSRFRRAYDLLRARRARGGVAYAIYAWLDRRRVGVHDDPLARQDCSSSLGGIDAILVTPISRGTAQAFPADSLARIEAARLDVLVQCGFGTLTGAVLAAAAFGVWSLRPGDNARFDGRPACFWEMVEGSPVTGMVLLRLTGEGNGAFVLDRAYFPTDSVSMARTRHQAYYGSTHLVIRRLKHLHEWGWSGLEARLPIAIPGPGRERIDRFPTDREVLAWLVPLALRRVVARAKRAVSRSDDVEHWRIAIRTGHPRLRLEGPADMGGFRWLEAPRGHFYADPFVVEREGRRWLFVEDYSYVRKAGVIGCGEITANGDFVYSGPVLSSTGHLSYPMVAFDGQEALMVPESSEEGCVRVYRATAFPQQWELIAQPYAGVAVDTSIWQQNERWWFFTTVREPRGRADMLMLFHADAIDGEWVPHPMNPISQDVRSVRGAGGLYVDDGRLVRPSQDGSRGYGYSFTLNEITTLSVTDYVERPCVSIEPDWDPHLLGTHTYNRVEGVEVTDGKVSRPRRSIM